MIKIIIFASIGVVQFAQAAPSAETLEQQMLRVARSETWLKMLHYKEIKKGKFHSLLDGPGFFMAKDGQHNPLSELRKTLESFYSQELKVGRENQHPQCAFPLRYQFIKQHLAVNIDHVACHKLDQFMAKFDLNKIFLVFSTAYPNNPGSMFGHTFLRIGSSRPNAPSGLDHSISYAAFTPPGEEGLIFAIKGIFGGYQGFFSTMPYYVKVSEYNNHESRDIWEYQLTMTASEVRKILLHVWEIETNSYFDYYFFSENCAYHLLSLLEVARPQLNITDYFLYMAPADSIKKVMAITGLIKAVHFRPSLRRQVSAHYARLNDRQRSLAQAIVHDSTPPPTSDPHVLDTAIAHLNHLKLSTNSKHSSSEKLNQLLLKRSRLPQTPPPSPLSPATNRPDWGHDSRLVEWRSGVSQNQGGRNNFFQEFHFQTAYHDLMANGRGYEPFSEILFPSITLRYQHSKWFFEQLNLLQITSLYPSNPIDHKFSWGLKLRLLQNRWSLHCEKHFCPQLNFRTGLGLSQGFLNQSLLISLMLFANVEIARELSHSYSLGPLGKVQVIAMPLSWYKSALTYAVYRKVLGGSTRPLRSSLDWSHAFFLGKNIEIKMTISHKKEDRFFLQGKLGLRYYFM